LCVFRALLCGWSLPPPPTRPLRRLGGGGRGAGPANYIADIHLDVANSAKRAFNAVSLRHRLRDISTLT
jgi:hypothetical protein